MNFNLNMSVQIISLIALIVTAVVITATRKYVTESFRNTNKIRI